MAQHINNELPQQFTHGKVTLLNGIALVFFVIVIGFVGILKYREFLLSQQRDFIQTQKDAVNQEIQELEKKNLSELFIASRAVADIETKLFLWSKFVKLLSTITPEEIVYSSYGVSLSGDVTLAAFAPSFASVASLIRILESQPSFSSIFVPSLSRGKDLVQNELVSFNLVMDYIQKAEGVGKARK